MENFSQNFRSNEVFTELINNLETAFEGATFASESQKQEVIDRIISDELKSISIEE